MGDNDAEARLVQRWENLSESGSTALGQGVANSSLHEGHAAAQNLLQEKQRVRARASKAKDSSL